jgi:hypothetical protein
MVYGFVEKSKQRPTWHEMLHAILRNFGGLDQVNPVRSFRENLSKVVQFDERVSILLTYPLLWHMSYIFALVHLQTIFSDHRPFFQSID